MRRAPRATPATAPTAPSSRRLEPGGFKHEDIENDAALIDRSPKVVSNAVDLEEDFVQVPFIAGSNTPSPGTVGIVLTELLPPASDRFAVDHDLRAAITSSTSRKLMLK